ncbi:hypothetical protein SLH46_06680 [Draconibacterium sp. IB214405]|uniref:hypothetical protein n=1 Tax=Draconibacterium sp. IB214405 TaxID=3097352 RepID=UPI002A14EAE1|nr:hypothetical protein [Draconibacterium sp. IB214405]MDX8338859.1 hypothetical protein [Draconibacterium sp. IB214405]
MKLKCIKEGGLKSATFLLSIIFSVQRCYRAPEVSGLSHDKGYRMLKGSDPYKST